MPQAPVIELDALLEPIPGENPSGENLRYSGLHDEIREARRADDDVAQGVWTHELKVPDWEKVVSLSTDALAHKTKDLQLAAWLSEALVKLHGFAGLRDSLRLMSGLNERFWDTVYPEIDEGDMEARANAIAWMDRQASLAMKEVPLTKASGPNYSYLKFEEARELEVPENLASLDSTAQEKLASKIAAAVAEGKITGEDWRKAKNGSRRAFYEELFQTVGECRAEFAVLDRVMDEKFGRQTPGLGELKKGLEGIGSVVEKTVKEKRIAEPDPSEAGASVGGEPGAAAAGQGFVRIAGGAIQGRAEALQRLSEVADFFRATEPHSPVSYLVQRAVSWGRMPLDRWLEDVIKDGAVLAQLRETLGLNEGGSGGSDSGA